MEKLNHMTKLEWSRGTNHHDDQNEQILKRRLRIDLYLNNTGNILIQKIMIEYY